MEELRTNEIMETATEELSGATTQALAEAAKTGLSTGEKVAVAGFTGLAAVGAVTLGYLCYKGIKKGVNKVKAIKVAKANEEFVKAHQTESSEQPVEEKVEDVVEIQPEEVVEEHKKKATKKN